MRKNNIKINAAVIFILMAAAFIPQLIFEKNLPLIISFYFCILLFSLIRMNRGIDILDAIVVFFTGIITLEVFLNSSDIIMAEKRFFLTYVPSIVLFLIAKNQEKEAYAPAIKSITAVCLLISIYMIYEFFTGKNFIFNRITPNIFMENKLFYGNRAFGIFDHPTVAGAFLTMLFPFIALFLSGEENKIKHLFGHVLFIVVSVAIFLTFSKMSWAILGGMYLWYLRQKGMRIRNSILIVFFIAAVIFFIKTDVLKHQFSPYFMITAVDYRLKSFFITINMIKQHPIVGVGLDHFKLLYSNYSGDPNVPYTLKTPDNMYLMILAETGIITFMSFAAFTGFLIKKTIGKIKNTPEGPEKLLIETAFVSVIGALAHSFSFDSFYWGAPLVMFWMLAGALNNLARD